MSEPLENIEELLRQVVLAVVEAGQAAILYEFPQVLAYFGAQIPVSEFKERPND